MNGFMRGNGAVELNDESGPVCLLIGFISQLSSWVGSAFLPTILHRQVCSAWARKASAHRACISLSRVFIGLLFFDVMRWLAVCYRETALRTTNCFFPKTITDSKGKDKKTYPYECMMTPYDKLKSIENAINYLKSDITFELLDKVALSQNDDQAAEQLQKERSKLFKTINERDLKSG